MYKYFKGKSMKIDIKKFKPLGDLVLVEFEPVKLETESGIIMQTRRHFNDRPTQGKVIAIGPKVEEISVGDCVKFENIRGYDIDETHLLLGYKTILGVIETTQDTQSTKD